MRSFVLFVVVAFGLPARASKFCSLAPVDGTPKGAASARCSLTVPHDPEIVAKVLADSPGHRRWVARMMESTIVGRRLARRAAPPAAGRNATAGTAIDEHATAPAEASAMADPAGDADAAAADFVYYRFNSPAVIKDRDVYTRVTTTRVAAGSKIIVEARSVDAPPPPAVAAAPDAAAPEAARGASCVRMPYFRTVYTLRAVAPPEDASVVRASTTACNACGVVVAIVA